MFKKLKIFSLNCSFAKFRTISARKPSELLKWKISLGHIEQDDIQSHVIRKLDKVHTSLLDYKPGKSLVGFRFYPPKGLYIYGSVGAGKTMLMDVFYESCQTTQKRKAHFNEFMSEVHQKIHSALKERSSRKSKKRFEPWNPIPSVAAAFFQETWLLCFDEFQVTDIVDAMILKALFTELFTLGVVMVATSNRHPEDLYKDGLNRENFEPFIAVLNQYCHIVSMDSEVDHRSRKAEEADDQSYYFITGEPSTNEILDRIFESLVAEEDLQDSAVELIVQGRTIEFLKACGGVLDTTFQEICERDLGSNDYVRIAAQFHTVIVRNVPQLNISMKNQVKRFIQLIDILYSQNRRVTVSAAVPLKELFVPETAEENSQDDRELFDNQLLQNESNKSGNSSDNEEVFAFKRTISRLQEMTTQEYWHQAKRQS